MNFEGDTVSFLGNIPMIQLIPFGLPPLSHPVDSSYIITHFPYDVNR